MMTGTSTAAITETPSRAACGAACRVHVYDAVIGPMRLASLIVTPRPGESAGHLARRAAAAYVPCAGGEPLAVLVDGLADPETLARPLAGGERIIVAPAPGDPSTALTVSLFVVGLIVSSASALLLQPELPDASTSSDTEQSRSSFGRFSNNAFPGDTIPPVFGAVKRYGGKVVQTVRAANPTGDGDSVVRMLVCFGHGPIRSIGGFTSDADALSLQFNDAVYLNDQPARSFPSVRAWVRLGSDDQDPIPGFDDAATTREVGSGGGVVLRNTSGSVRSGTDASAEAFTFTTAGDVDGFRLTVQLPSGLFRVVPGGQIEQRRVRYRVRYRIADTGGGSPGSWGGWQLVTIERAERGAFQSVPEFRGFGVRTRYDIQAERVDPEDDDTAIADRLRWDQVAEIIETDSDYAGYAMLALELTASDQLTGIPTVAADVEGQSNLRIWDGVSDPATPVFTRGYSRNPAWAALEILTNSVWGAGAMVGDDRIDMASLIDWAETCGESVPVVIGGGTRPRYTMDAAIAESSSPRELLARVAACGRARAVTTGERYRFTGFAPQAAPVEVFTPADIAADDEGRPLVQYRYELGTGGVTRPNQIIAQYADNAQGGEVETVKAPPDGERWLATETARPRTLRLDGVTHREQAAALAWHAIKRDRLLTRSIRVTLAVPALALQAGDRFDLAEPTAGYGLASGACRGGTVSGVVLDQPVTLAAATDYELTVTIAATGQTVTRSVTAAAGSYADGDTLTVSPDLPAAPMDGDGYTLGELARAAKPFLATSVALEDREQGTWVVEGVEYDATIDDDDADIVEVPAYSTLVVADAPPGPVIDLTAQDYDAGGGDVRLLIGWRQTPDDEQRTATFKVFRRRIGASAWLAEPAAVVSRVSSVIDVDDEAFGIEIAVVAVTPGGTSLSPYDPAVPIVQISYGLAAPPADAPATLTIDREADGTYTATASAVDDAVQYQWLAGGVTTSKPNAGAEDCLVLARTTDPELGGLLLPPGVATRLFVRAVNDRGRMSFSAQTAQVASPVSPPGLAADIDETYALATDGTLDNLAWSSGASRLELVSASSPGVWTSDPADAGSVKALTIGVHMQTANDAQDPNVEDLTTLRIPSLEADQWGTLAAGPTGELGMLMPPFPDNANAYTIEVRTSEDGSLYSSWVVLTPYQPLERTTRYVQARVTLTRTKAPYRPALAGVTLFALGA